MRHSLIRTTQVIGLVLGLSLFASVGTAYAGTEVSDYMSQGWGNATVKAQILDGKLIASAELTDTGKDGKCVYVEYRADIRFGDGGSQFANDPDKTVVKVCGTDNTGSDRVVYTLGVFDTVHSVEFKLCKKGWLQDPCIKKKVYPTA